MMTQTGNPRAGTRWFLTTLVIAASSLILSCGFDSSHKSDEEREASDREELVQTYSQIQGVYRGAIHTSKKDLELKLTLTFKEVVVGKDSEGQPRYRPVLVARFSRPGLVVLDIRMEGTYSSSSGNLTLSTEANGGEYFQIRGQLIGSNLNGEIKTSSGSTYGQLSGKLETRQVQTAEGDDLEQADRIRKHLLKLAGTYEGVVTPEDITGPFRASIRLDVEEELSSEKIPSLVAYYERIGGGSLSTRLKVQYFPERSPAEISFSSSGATGNNIERVSFLGIILDNEIRGQLSYPAFRAKFVANKK